MDRRSLPVAVIAVIAAVFAAASASAATNDGGAHLGCVNGSIQSLRSGQQSYAAQAVRPLNARRSLAGPTGIRFGVRNLNGAVTTFGVLAARRDRSCRATHYRVQLPVRPNGATGWVRAADVRISLVNTRIAIDLSQRRMILMRAGKVVFSTTVAIGAPATPTPTGDFYVNQRLLTNRSGGAYGPGAVGISAYSPVLRRWAQGGPIAIHGTNAPASIGFAASYGCLRVRNADASKLLRLAVEGTPVEIRR